MGWNPWTEVGERSELTVVFVPGCPVAGAYFPDRNLIVIAAGQSRAMRRSVVAEELGHHELGHRRSPQPREVDRMEHQARAWAAKRLITEDDLADGLIGATHWSDVAETLDVDVALLKDRLLGLSGQAIESIRRRVGDHVFTHIDRTSNKEGAMAKAPSGTIRLRPDGRYEIRIVVEDSETGEKERRSFYVRGSHREANQLRADLMGKVFAGHTLDDRTAVRP